MGAERGHNRPTSVSISRVPGRSARSARATSGPARVSSAGRPSAIATPSMSGYSKVFSANHCWVSRGEQPRDELRGVGVDRCRLGDADPGDVDQRARVAGCGEGVLRPHRVGADLGGLLVPVVVVDQAELRLAGVDGIDDQAVLLIGLHVVRDEGLEPGLRRLVTLRLAHRRDEGLERGVRRGDGDLALPRRVRQVEHRLRHLVGGHLLGVVDDDTGATAHAGPGAVGGDVGRRDVGRDALGQRGQQPLGRDGAQGAGVLGEEDLGGGGVALLEQLRRELGAVAEPGLDRDAGLLGELGEQRRHQLLAAAGVDDDAVLRGDGGARRAAGDGQGDGGESPRRGRPEPRDGWGRDMRMDSLVDEVRLTLLSRLGQRQPGPQVRPLAAGPHRAGGHGVRPATRCPRSELQPGAGVHLDHRRRGAAAVGVPAMACTAAYGGMRTSTLRPGATLDEDGQGRLDRRLLGRAVRHAARA